ncbi:MAG: hypothetical protein ACHQAX_03630 [Gammaproteobacteria bacterium]
MLPAENLKQYIESKRGIAPNKTIANHVLEDGVITDNDFKYLDRVYQKYKTAQPLKGKRILFNQHMDWATFLLMLLYQSLGATIEASNLNLTAKSFAKSALDQAGILYYAHQIPNHATNYYHHVVDCGAGMINAFTPLNGMAELTQTYPIKYEGKKTPVFSVNRWFVKKFEDYYGVGPACMAALPSAVGNLLTRQAGLNNAIAIDQNIEAIYERRLSLNYYVIVGGAGQVAAGIAHALIEKGVKEDHILLVDREEKNALTHVMDKTKNIAFLKNQQGELVGLSDKTEFKQAILAHMQKTKPNANYTLDNFSQQLAIITATGVENLMSNYNYSPLDFHPTATWFINMGQPDEYGDNFEQTGMVGNTKFALNFNPQWLKRDNGKHPATPTYCLMPSFAALAESSIYAIVNHKKRFNPGLQAIPSTYDHELLEYAVQIYGDEFQPMMRLMEERMRRECLASPTDSASSTDTRSSMMTSPSPPTSPPRNGSSPDRVGNKRSSETLVSSEANPNKDKTVSTTVIFSSGQQNGNFHNLRSSKIKLGGPTQQ